MKHEEIKKMSAQEMSEELARLRKKTYDLRCQAASEKIEDPSQFKKTRRDIARILTEQSAQRNKNKVNA